MKAIVIWKQDVVYSFERLNASIRKFKTVPIQCKRLEAKFVSAILIH